MRPYLVVVLALVGVLATPHVAAAPAPSSYRPISLEQLSPLAPVNPSSSLPIQFRAGWPLIFRASVKDKDMLGIGRVYDTGTQEPEGWTFPEVGQGGAIVLKDPDHIWSFGLFGPVPRDELFIDFYPDPGDVSERTDSEPGALGSGDGARRMALRPEFGGPLPYSSIEGDWGIVPVADGVQFGADDDFPGLVLLSNVGVGVVMTSLFEGWHPVSPRTARNLAGFNTSVGYELTDKLGRTSITSMLVVPRFLFSRIRVVDPCTGHVNVGPIGFAESCDGPALERVDGGPLQPEAPASQYDESLATIRAFVVAPKWNPVTGQVEYLDQVVDMSGDGEVTAADAQLMGWQVLSNEVVFSFRQIGSNVTYGRFLRYSGFSLCMGTNRPDISGLPAGANFTADLDGNGTSTIGSVSVCPLGGSGVTRPPR